MPVFQINFSRPAGQIVAQYYNFVRLGREGYQAVQDTCYKTSQFLAEEIVKLGPFELLCDGNPLTGIPTVAWRIKEGEDPGYTLYDVADRLRVKGWQVPAYPLTGSVSDISIQRILVRQGVSRDLAVPAARRHAGSHRPLRQAPGDGGHDRPGVGRLQPPVRGAGGASAVAAHRAAGGRAQSTRRGRFVTRRGRPTVAGRSVVHGAGRAWVSPASPRSAGS